MYDSSNLSSPVSCHDGCHFNPPMGVFARLTKGLLLNQCRLRRDFWTLSPRLPLAPPALASAGNSDVVAICLAKVLRAQRRERALHLARHETNGERLLWVREWSFRRLCCPAFTGGTRVKTCRSGRPGSLHGFMGPVGFD